MKKLCMITWVLVSAISTSVAAHWGDELVTKEKRESKRYTVNASGKLFIDNKYGHVNISTWDKNEVTVDIVIKVKGGSDAKAQNLLDGITIDESENRNSGRISFKTEIAKTRSGSFRSGNGKSWQNISEMDIDYTVNMPRKFGLDVTDKFGSVDLGDFDGDMNVTVEYGNVKTQRLAGAAKKIAVKFGKVDIESIEAGKLDIAYTDLVIAWAQKIEVKSQFGKTKIDGVGSLDIDQRYGDLFIGSVDALTAYVAFANLDIGKLSASADLTLKYSTKAMINSIRPGVRLVNVNANFSTICLGFENGVSLAADMDVSFGSLKNHSAAVMNIEVDYSNTQRYRGKIGSGAGKLVVHSSYGDVVFQ